MIGNVAVAAGVLVTVAVAVGVGVVVGMAAWVSASIVTISETIVFSTSVALPIGVGVAWGAQAPLISVSNVSTSTWVRMEKLFMWTAPYYFRLALGNRMIDRSPCNYSSRNVVNM
jgi:hypothetical protein